LSVDDWKKEAVNDNPTAPWIREEVFPEKPREHDYGYVLRGKLVGCSREELIARCSSSDQPYIQLVWHPDSLRLIPATHVEFLHEALKERERKALKSNLNIAIFVSVIAAITFALKGNWAWFGILGIFLGVWPALQSIRGLRALRYARWSPPEEGERGDHYVVWVDSQRILFTWILLGLIICIMIVENATVLEHAVEAAGLDKHAVRRGEWWRLLTGPLLHGGFYHIAFNGFALVGLGRLMEVLASRYHLAIVFLFSALCGSLLGLVLAPNSLSVGASGGLMGLIGFFAVLGMRRRKVLPAGFVNSIFINILVIAAMGIIGYAIIDNAGHLGGLVGGVIMGLILISRNDQSLPLKPGVPLKVAGMFSFLVVLAFGCLAIFKMIK
jgi:membrane associated rhomboid family serine protease